MLTLTDITTQKHIQIQTPTHLYIGVCDVDEYGKILHGTANCIECGSEISFWREVDDYNFSYNGHMSDTTDLDYIINELRQTL